MTKRSVPVVLILSLFTFGIYPLYWFVVTKREMNNLGADIPTSWLILVPFVNIWWEWRFCAGVERVTKKELSQVISFILLFALSIIGMAIIQAKLNEAANREPLPGARAVAA